LDDLPAGTYQPGVSHPGYRTPMLPPVDVVVGQTTDFGFIDLHREADTAVLRGQITSVADGQPIAGAQVSVTGVISDSTLTDPAGHYELLSDRAGSLNIQVSRSGYREVTATAAWVLGQVQVFSPALYPIDFEPPAHAILLGEVRSADDDQPIAGAVVSVGSDSTTSDADGRFLLQPLPPGDFSATVASQGFLDSGITGVLVSGVNDAGVVRLQPESTAGLSQLSGQVRDASNGTPLVGALVEVLQTGQRALSDTQGDYQIADINTVPFSIRASLGGYQSREVQIGSQTHGSFAIDLPLDRLLGTEVLLEGLSMSAPEALPNTEVGLLANVRNVGTAAAGLVFSAVIRDSTGQFVREVPAIMRTAASLPGHDVQTIEAGATLVVTITWGLPGDLEGDYSVEFRGLTPVGQLVLQGNTGYRVLASRRLGGGVILDPPLLTAGLNQSVKLDARLANHGNLPIAPGEVELSITLAVPDDRPPLPPEPEIVGERSAGAPLNRPKGATLGPDGSLYTVNQFTRELVRVGTDGQATVLRTLSFQFNGNGASMGLAGELLYCEDGRLRLAWNRGYVSAIEITEPFAQIDEQLPLTTLSAYTWTVGGQQYAAGTHEGRYRLVRINSGGQIDVLAEEGFGSPSAVTTGPDAAVYVSNSVQGVVHRIDSSSGVVSVYADGLVQPSGLVFDAAGALLVAERTLNRVVRWNQGVVSVAATDIPDPRELRIGLDGQLYVLSYRGQIYRGQADGGAASLFASGSVASVAAVRFDDQGNALLLASNELRRRNADGSVETLASGLVNARDVMPVPGSADLLIVEATGIKRLSGGLVGPWVAPESGVQLQELTTNASGQTVVVGSLNSDFALWRLAGQQLIRELVHPTQVSQILQMGSR
ncbi:MAG: carboxypeptidase regulatory-like domain-containing protein, partial [Xanthomonadales bacterium]|nr:carboxypeptidase regulatory-like domain-containing protein [Xanthomonadales bacterium]